MAEARWEPVARLLGDAVGPVFPAAQLLVVDAGAAVWARAVGDCTPATLFDVASLTKPLCTTTLVMRLCEQGRLELDDEARPGVTVRHLLEHASGLPAWKSLEAAPGAKEARQGVVEAVAREPLEAQPGTRARYSDLGFILLGDVVERAGGARLDALFARELAAPLGLGATFCPPDAAACAPTEGELRGVVHDENARAMGGVAGHAGLFSSASDVSAIAAALVAAWRGAGDQLVEPATVRRFWSPSAVSDSTWCLGWDRPATTGSAAGERWPKDGVGHLGYTGCSLWIAPARARWVVLLSNRVHPTRANEQIKSFRPLIYDAIVAALDGPP
jgi:CubicO group peptidase (beta-lactamase class C family)